MFQEVWPWLRRFKTYAEFSQSGEGLHLICKANLPKGAKNRYDLGEGIGVEVYTKGRYFVMTGDRMRFVSDRSVNEQQEAVDGLLAALNAHAKNGKPEARQRARYSDDDAIIAKAEAAKNGSKFSEIFNGGGSFPSDSERDLALAAMLGSIHTTRDRSSASCVRANCLVRSGTNVMIIFRGRSEKRSIRAFQKTGQNQRIWGATSRRSQTLTSTGCPIHSGPS